MAEIVDTEGKVISRFPLAELVPGSYSGQWGWQHQAGWEIPGNIPVGRYRVGIIPGCGGKRVAKAPFYVIFDPGEVNGPDRFSFNETGVWFGASTNMDRAMLYHLHPDDKRIFDLAVEAASGETGQADDVTYTRNSCQKPVEQITNPWT